MRPRTIFYLVVGVLIGVLFVAGLAGVIANPPTPGVPTPAGFMLGGAAAMLSALLALVIAFFHTVMVGNDPTREQHATSDQSSPAPARAHH
jgi:hypothetical protein